MLEDKFATCDKSELVFDQSVVKSSITEDFGMVCEESYQRALFIALFASGRLIGILFLLSIHYAITYKQNLV